MQRETHIIVGLAVVAATVVAFLFLPEAFSGISFSTGTYSKPEVSVPFTEIVRGDTSTVTRRVNYFVTSTEGLNKLWGMIDATSTPPTVDFNKNAVIAVFAGPKPTTGYAITVSKIRDTDARLVAVTIVEPDNGCVLAQSMTAPYAIVTVPTTSLPLAHEDISITSTCAN